MKVNKKDGKFELTERVQYRVYSSIINTIFVIYDEISRVAAVHLT